MKKVVSGIGLLIVATVIFVNVHQTAVNNYSKINDWSIAVGKYFSSMKETSGVIPFVISIIMGIAGLILILCGCLENQNTNKNSKDL